MRKRVYILGAVLGILVPFVGVFVGLQVSSIWGTILAAPFVFMVLVTGIPIGMMHPLVLLVGVGLSVGLWIGIVALTDRFFKK